MTPVERLRDSLLLGGEVYEVPEHEAILAALDVVAATTAHRLALDPPERCRAADVVDAALAAFGAAVEGATT